MIGPSTSQSARPHALEASREALLDGERWYVAQTLHNREKLAAMHLHAQGFRSFFPKFRKTVRHARQLREVIAPVFCGYLFIIIDSDRDSWRSINGTIGICKLLNMMGRPIPVPDGVVESLMSAVEPSGLIQLGGDLRPGQSVRILAGPFAGALGELDRLDAKGRVRVLLNIMGGQAPMMTDRANLTAG